MTDFSSLFGQMLSIFPDILRCPSPFSRMKVLKVKMPHEHSFFNIPAEIITFLFSGSPTKALQVEYLKVFVELQFFFPL